MYLGDPGLMLTEAGPRPMPGLGPKPGPGAKVEDGGCTSRNRIQTAVPRWAIREASVRLLGQLWGHLPASAVLGCILWSGSRCSEFSSPPPSHCALDVVSTQSTILITHHVPTLPLPIHMNQKRDPLTRLGSGEARTFVVSAIYVLS